LNNNQVLHANDESKNILIEESLNSTKKSDDLKEEMSHLKRLNEEDQASEIKTPPPTTKKLQKNEWRLQTRRSRVKKFGSRKEKCHGLSQKETERSSKKYGFTLTAILLAAGATIGTVVGSTICHRQSDGKWS